MVTLIFTLSSLLHYQPNPSVFLNEGFGMMHYDGVNLLNCNRLTVFAFVEFSGVDLVGDLVNSHTVSARRYQINNRFYKAHN